MRILLFNSPLSDSQSRRLGRYISVFHKMILTWGKVCFSWIAVALASYDGNLNYRSPSLSHAGLGIDVPRLQSRMFQKRNDREYETENLSFTHGVASVGPHL